MLLRVRIPAKLAASAAIAVLCAVAGNAGPAGAASAPAPGWRLTASTIPTHIPPGGQGNLKINLYNAGAAPSAGPVTVTDTLPEGVIATKASDFRELVGLAPRTAWDCTLGHVVTCVSDPAESELPSIGVGEKRGLGIALEAVGGPGHGTNEVEVAGGEATTAASTTNDVVIDAQPEPFGLSGFDAWLANPDATAATQAGSHPYGVTVALTFTSGATTESQAPSGQVRELHVVLPRGLVGNVTSMPQCPRQMLDARKCPPSTQVGFDMAYAGELEQELPVYNVVPPPGVPAQFGFQIVGVVAFIDFGVSEGRGGVPGDYSLTADSHNVPQRGVLENTTTIWGVPADPSHDAQRRGPGCSNGCPTTNQPRPLLTLPTACGEPQTFQVTATSWQDPPASSSASVRTHESDGTPVGFTGCDLLGFAPDFSLAPEVASTDSASGLDADLKMSQEGLEAPSGLAGSNLRSTVVQLAEGVSVNPGQAAGLLACQPSQANLGEPGPPACPPASQIGTAKIQTPLLADPPEGSLFLLTSNPPDLEVLLAASVDGVNLKLTGHVHLDEGTGRITATFTDTPDLPFSDLKLTFNGPPRAALVTPSHCGVFGSAADLTPWASPSLADASLQPAFALNTGPEGGGCPPAQLPFGPTMTAGSTSTEAGGFTGFMQLLQRDDGQQRLERFQFTEPAGLSALISTVSPCPEPQASQGTCSPASHIGHAIVTSGPGSNPLVIPQPGAPEAAIYLTGAYKGAPFGLSIVTPVLAGPFDLGTIVTRAKIDVDPRTAQVTITTDPLPQILDGVPTDLRSIYAVIDRPGFFFNPTDCTARQFTGTATSAGAAATAQLSSRFAVGGCRGLTFAPKFTASTQGSGTFNRNGASLKVKIATGQGPKADPAASAEANIKKVDVALPVQLPSRLSTLQKACTERQFAANPAACPQASNVGTATAHTPVLPVPLTGPAYLVSHGGAAFPDLDIVLQGDGVTILLTGSTDIKKGVTFSRFDTTPDAPFSSFELNLPEGKFSALAANGNLCKPTETVTVKKRVAVRRHGRIVHVVKRVKQQAATTLAMPTTITGQNGAVVTQTTKVAVTGCPKAKKLVKKHKKAKSGKRHKRSK